MLKVLPFPKMISLLVLIRLMSQRPNVICFLKISQKISKLSTENKKLQNLTKKYTRTVRKMNWENWGGYNRTFSLALHFKIWHTGSQLRLFYFGTFQLQMRGVEVDEGRHSICLLRLVYFGAPHHLLILSFSHLLQQYQQQQTRVDICLLWRPSSTSASPTPAPEVAVVGKI